MDARELEAASLLARCLANVGKNEEARDILQGVVAADPKDFRSRRLLVSVLLASGDYAGAEPHAALLAETTGGRDRAPALFFLAHAMWGMGNLNGCRRAVDDYVAAMERDPLPVPTNDKKEDKRR